MGVVLQRIKAAISLDFTLLEHDDTIGKVQEVDSVCDKNASLVFKHALEHLLEDLFTHVCVKGGDGIIHHDYIGVGVDGSGKTDSGFLPT